MNFYYGLGLDNIFIKVFVNLWNATNISIQHPVEMCSYCVTVNGWYNNKIMRYRYYILLAINYQ